MAQFFAIHPTHPQVRLVTRAADIVKKGGVMVYPTDSCYALACQLGEKSAEDRMRTIRGIDETHHFTLVCRDLAEISRYAKVDNVQFRLLKANTPGSYTFILPATGRVPKRLHYPKRNTIGLRVPEHPVAQALLGELAAPLWSTSLVLPGETQALSDPESIRERLEHQVDVIIDSGNCGLELTSIIDLTSGEPQLIREGKGDLQPFRLR